MPVIDASCYIAIINTHEPGHSAARTWFQNAASSHQPIIAPNILLAEVAAALSRGMGNAPLAHRVINHLKGSKVIELKPVTPAVAELAATIAADQRIRGCDAVYVALALQLNEELITLDRQQLQRGAQVVPARQP